LPWNTKKTDIDPSSDVFDAIKGHLKKYASKYRTQNRRLRKNKEGETKKEASPKSDQIEMLDAGGRGKESKGAFGDGQVDDGVSNKLDDKGSLGVGESKYSDKSTSGNGGKYKIRTKIEKSSAITKRLDELESPKISQLYSSLCVISLVEHPVMMSVGAWALFENLAKLLGANSDTSFNSYFSGKINEWYKDKNMKKAFKKIIRDVSERGNLDKHEGKYYTVDAKQLAVDFAVADPLILKILDEIIAKKKT